MKQDFLKRFESCHKIKDVSLPVSTLHTFLNFCIVEYSEIASNDSFLVAHIKIPQNFPTSRVSLTGACIWKPKTSVSHIFIRGTFAHGASHHAHGRIHHETELTSNRHAVLVVFPGEFPPGAVKL